MIINNINIKGCEDYTFLTTTTKIALAQSFLLPKLEYDTVSYLDITEEQLYKSERLQNFVLHLYLIFPKVTR